MATHHVLSAKNPRFKSLLNALKEAKSLVVVVGAGVSMEAALPSWDLLVRRMLESGLNEAKAAGAIGKNENVQELIKAFRDDTDLLRVATFCKQLHGDQRDNAIHNALYKGFMRAPRPGRTARAIAALAVHFDSVRIVTTNYDTLIETAIAEVGARTSIRVGPDEEWPSEVPGGPIPVYHVHGCIPFSNSEPNLTPVVLDERDFVFSQQRPKGREIKDLLAADVTLFVGMSINDPNMVAALSQMTFEPGQSAFGLFGGQGSASAANGTIKRLASARLGDMHVMSLDLASYSQVSQILYEGLIRRVDSLDRYWADAEKLRYGWRLVEWREAAQKQWLIETEDEFARSQGKIHDRLVRTLEEDLDGKLLSRTRGENLGIHIWARKPGDDLGRLQLWGSSVEHHREVWSLRASELPLAANTGYPVVDSLYYGSTKLRPESDRENDRWAALLALPIELIEAPWRNLLVGAISLSSTKPLSESCLNSADLAAVGAVLEQAGRDLLDPLITDQLGRDPAANS